MTQLPYILVNPLQLISLFITIFVISFAVICIILRLISSKKPVIVRYAEEYNYFDPISNKHRTFPTLNDPPEVYLSVIVPAYNEESRLPIMLNEAIQYLQLRCRNDSQFTYEIIIVDDGSRDNTTQIGMEYVKEYGINKIRVLTLHSNRGKGGAVRLGMMSSRGKLLLFADADGATRFEDFQKLEQFMRDNDSAFPPPIAIGSRAHLEKQSIATRSFFRTILMYGFHFGVWLLTVRSVRDTQCGFKLFSREMANVIFSHIHVERWAFDVELLLIAEHLKCKVNEIAVNWTEIEGSKVTPFWSWIQMGKDVALISLKYTIGAWEFPCLSQKHN